MGDCILDDGVYGKFHLAKSFKIPKEQDATKFWSTFFLAIFRSKGHRIEHSGPKMVRNLYLLSWEIVRHNTRTALLAEENKVIALANVPVLYYISQQKEFFVLFLKNNKCERILF